MIGAIWRQGPHHSAQKSMMAGLSDWSTSLLEGLVRDFHDIGHARFSSAKAGTLADRPEARGRPRGRAPLSAAAPSPKLGRATLAPRGGDRAGRGSAGRRPGRAGARRARGRARRRSARPLEACAPAIAGAALRLAETFRAGGRVLCFGNGGSAADAQHLAAELAGRFVRERPGLPALALTANTLGPHRDRQRLRLRRRCSRGSCEAHGRAGDVRGRDLDVGQLAERACRRRGGARRGALEPRAHRGGGGKLAAAVDLAIVVPSDVTARIQEAHIAVIHVLCELIDAPLFPEPGRR